MLEVEIGCTLHLSFDIKIQKDTIALLQFIRKTFIFSMLTLFVFFSTNESYNALFSQQ
jgi:hypothetical protein